MFFITFHKNKGNYSVNISKHQKGKHIYSLNEPYVRWKSESFLWVFIFRYMDLR